MQELLDKIRYRNFGVNLELKSYRGEDKATLALLAAGIDCYSLYADGKDIRVTLYPFNASRDEEKTDDLAWIVSRIIKAFQ